MKSKTIDLLFIALLFAISLVLRLSISPASGKDLVPGPDALEYADTARRLAYAGVSGIEVASNSYPSRYPMMFPLMLVPLVWITGGRAYLYWMGMAACGATSVVLSYASSRFLGARRIPSCLGAGLFAFSVTHIFASHYVMSDLPALILYQTVVLIACLKRHKSWHAVVAGLCIGAMPATRLGSLPMAAVAFTALTILFWHRRKMSALFVLAAVMGVIPEIISRWTWFHTLKNVAYGYWVPSFRPGSGFVPMSISWVTAPNTSGMPNIKYFGRMLLGLDPSFLHLPYISTALLAGSIWACWLLGKRNNNKAILSLLFVAGPFLALVLQLFYYYQAPRLLLPMIVPASVGAVAMLDSLLQQLERIFRRKDWMLAWGSFVAGCVLLLPASTALRSRKPSDRFDFPAGDVRHLLYTVKPAIVLTDFGTLYTRNVLLPPGKHLNPLILPLTDELDNDEHAYRVNRIPNWPDDVGRRHAPVIARLSTTAGLGLPSLDADGLALLDKAAAGPIMLLTRNMPQTSQVMQFLEKTVGWKFELMHEIGNVRAFRVTLPSSPVEFTVPVHLDG